MHWSDRVDAADWIVGQLSDDLTTVAWMVPRQFREFARVLHPTVVGRDDERFPIRWSQIAAANSRALTSETHFADLVDVPGSLWTKHDLEYIGTLPVEEALVLAQVLRTLTSTPGRCWFGLSTEFGKPADADAPPERLVRAPHRSFRLYEGGIDDLTLVFDTYGWRHVPNLWWPEDRAWCVRTDIGHDSTYVGGGEGLVAALSSDSRLEVQAVELTTKVL